MPTSNTAWRVPPVAWVPIAAAVAAEAVSNALRAYGLGAHLDQFTLHLTLPGVAGGQPVPVSAAGGVLVLAAVAVSLSQARAAWVALTPGSARQRIVAGLAAVLLLAISVSAMASHILEAQRVKTSGEADTRGRHDRAKDAHKKAADELATLAGVRTIAEVRAAMDGAPVARGVFTRTAQCTDVTREDSFAACKPILDLRQEMGRAIRKAELEGDLKHHAAELAKLTRPEAARADEDLVARLWAWIMGLGVVFVATFGAVIFARVSERPNGSDASDGSGEGSAHRSAPPAAPASADRPNGSALLPQATDGSAMVRPVADRSTRRPFRRDEAEADLVTMLALGQPIPSQRVLAERWGRGKATVSDWMKGWDAAGLTRREAAGRCKRVVAA